MSYEEKQHNGFMLFGQNINPKAVLLKKKIVNKLYNFTEENISIKYCSLCFYFLHVSLLTNF